MTHRPPPVARLRLAVLRTMLDASTPAHPASARLTEAWLDGLAAAPDKVGVHRQHLLVRVDPTSSEWRMSAQGPLARHLDRTRELLSDTGGPREARRRLRAGVALSGVDQLLTWIAPQAPRWGWAVPVDVFDDQVVALLPSAGGSTRRLQAWVARHAIGPVRVGATFGEHDAPWTMTVPLGTASWTAAVARMADVAVALGVPSVPDGVADAMAEEAEGVALLEVDLLDDGLSRLSIALPCPDLAARLILVRAFGGDEKRAAHIEGVLGVTGCRHAIISRTSGGLNLSLSYAL